MPNARLTEVSHHLPPALSERILGYAGTVEVAVRDIFQEADLRYDDKLAEELVFIAGVKKLFSIVDSAFWVLDNANSLLARNETQSVRIGGTDYSATGKYASDMATMHDAFEQLLSRLGLRELVGLQRLPELLQRLSNERG